MRRPYLAHLDRFDGVDCWLVDGTWIRNRRDVDFTNGAHALTRGYIPAGEAWIDREAPGAGELRFLVAHLVREHALMRAGAPYLRALSLANRTERRLRRAALARPGLSPSQARAQVRRRRLGTLGRHQVWIVDGRGVRDRFDPNFTQGGHGLRYRFIPRREIWLDDAIAERELEATLAHEAHELRLMRDGMSYNEAHEHALALERRVRAALGGVNRVYSKVQKSSLLSKLCNIRFISY